MADEPQSPDAEAFLDELRELDVAQFVVSAAATLASLGYGKLEAGDLGQAKLAIDGVAALAELLDGDLRRDLGQALAGLQVAYADAASS